MAPKKDGPSKKNEQKKKAKNVEDRTFGLKNKNKSKKVQQHIQSVTSSVMNSGDRKQRAQEEQRKKVKADQKNRKKAALDEQNALFGEALMAVKKKGSTSQQDGKIEAKGRDHDDEGAKKGTSRAMKMMFQMDAQEMEDKLKEDPNYVPTLEDDIESQRQVKVAELKASGKGTPINPETFAVWQEKKQKRKREASKKVVEAELRKKKGGKGLAVLSGKDLYEYKKDLFKDHNEFGDTDPDLRGSDETVEEVAANVETKLFLAGGDEDLDDLDDE